MDEERLPAWRDPEIRVPFFLLVGIIAIGSVFYRIVEGWDVLDAVYFSIVTLATVGYGDFAPHTAAGKIFTMAYIVVGIGLLAVFARGVGQRWVDRRIRKIAQSQIKASETKPRSIASDKGFGRELKKGGSRASWHRLYR